LATAKKNAVKGREVLDGERGMFLIRSGGNGMDPYALTFIYAAGMPEIRI
jgi:hypothetical protein